MGIACQPNDLPVSFSDSITYTDLITALVFCDRPSHRRTNSDDERLAFELLLLLHVLCAGRPRVEDVEQVAPRDGDDGRQAIDHDENLLLRLVLERGEVVGEETSKVDVDLHQRIGLVSALVEVLRQAKHGRRKTHSGDGRPCGRVCRIHIERSHEDPQEVAPQRPLLSNQTVP
jgi:uncharacterized tellurite resistance protein B-like protein